MAETKIDVKNIKTPEEPSEVNWRSKYLELRADYDLFIEHYSDLGLQLQVNARNIKQGGFKNWIETQRRNLTQGV